MRDRPGDVVEKVRELFQPILEKHKEISELIVDIDVFPHEVGDDISSLCKDNEEISVLKTDLIRLILRNPM